MVIKVVELNWIFTKWWQNFMIGLTVFGIVVFTGCALTTEDLKSRLNYTYIIW